MIEFQMPAPFGHEVMHFFAFICVGRITELVNFLYVIYRPVANPCSAAQIAFNVAKSWLSLFAINIIPTLDLCVHG